MEKELRFEFGENWTRFLKVVNEERITRAESSLREVFETESLAGKRFLDIGCGSGLFSLAARSLGAEVHSFDYDARSVACCLELKRRYFPGDALWRIEKGDVLNEAYIKMLGRFDLVYSYGVLHHTGDMFKALDLAGSAVKTGGKMFISIYNDQGKATVRWQMIKKIYNKTPGALKTFILAPLFARLWGPSLLRDLMKGHPFSSWKKYAGERGMSPWHDVVDWVGGYPFEAAKPEDVLIFYRKRGFLMLKMKASGGHGCNDYVFLKEPAGWVV